jgi:hypothetical protein
MKHAVLSFGLALLLQGLACGAGAQEMYVAGAFGQASWNFDCGPNGCDRRTTAWRMAAGYRFNRVVAVEVFHMDFGRARSSTASLDGAFAAKASGAQVLAGCQFGGFDIAGKIGGASVLSEFEPSATSFDVAQRVRRTELIGGLMGGYRFTPNFGVRLDVDVVTAALDSNGIYYSRGSDIVTVVGGFVWNF